MVSGESAIPDPRILVDSSVWIDFLRGTEATHTALLKERIAEGEPLCLCGLILTEVLRGIPDERQFQETRRRFAVLEILPMTQPTFELATDIYRKLRQDGLSLRNASDTLIAAVALEQSLPLLHNDRDFDLIGLVWPLRFLGT